ncbi:MAG: alpha/beta hydrolase family protein [Isosphaeraceae bacterium]
MAFATINYYSYSLSKASTFNVVFPDGPDAERPWSVLYLLHGLSDDYTTWMRRSCVERYTLGYPLMIVMPDGGRGWYTNALDGDAYEDDLLKDVMGLIEKDFPVKAERGGRAIGGLSMGGFGAIKLGLKHPERFASVHSHSGLPALLQSPAEAKAISPETTRIFGPKPTGGPEDPFYLAKKADRKALPALRLDCGEEDPFLPGNREFRDHLTKLKIDHEYREHPGTHSWRYWDERVREAIDFHRRHLNIPDDLEHVLLR